MAKAKHGLQKVPTGIGGFDDLSLGGLPKGRVTVISGTAGSGKTIFGLSFLYRGIIDFDEPGVFVTFEEPRTEIIKETLGFGWDLKRLEKDGMMSFVDASVNAESQVEVGEYDFSALVARIEYAVGKLGAKRVVIDSVAALFLRYKDKAIVRRELFRIVESLRKLGVTSVITAERVRDDDESSRFGVEDFVADSVVFLYNTAVGRDRERQIEVVKLRGAAHRLGRHAMVINAQGITVFPGGGVGFAPDSPSDKISTGVRGLDEMTCGGVYRGSTSLVLGPSGTGRTVLGLHFLADGVKKRERGLLVSFEEGPAQIRMDTKSLGWDMASAEKSGLIKVQAWQPEEVPLEYYLQQIRELVAEYKPQRIVIDSLTPLVRSNGQQRFRRFFVALNIMLKTHHCTAFLNYTTGAGLESTVAAESDMAMVADNIVTMKLIDADTEMHREILIIKSRASDHDEAVRRYVVTGSGMSIVGHESDFPIKSRKSKRL